MLRQDQMLKLLMGSPKLQVETHSHGAEDSDTAQRDYGESAALERRVDVGLEVEIVLIILIHPKSEISNDKRLKNDQHLDKTWNVSSRSLDMLARTLSPELEDIDFLIRLIIVPGSIRANCALGNRVIVHDRNLHRFLELPV